MTYSNNVLFFKSKNNLCLILKLRKTDYVIGKHRMGQNIVTVFTRVKKTSEIPRGPSGIDQSLQIDSLKRSVNTNAQFPGEKTILTRTGHKILSDAGGVTIARI